jgi:hypothetical protein
MSFNNNNNLFAMGYYGSKNLIETGGTPVNLSPKPTNALEIPSCEMARKHIGGT